MHETLAPLFLVHLIALLAVSLALVYPMYSHIQNVAHTRALALQSGALFTLTLGIGVAVVLEPEHLAGELLFTVSTVLLLSSMWLFAREFVRRDDRLDDSFDGAFGDEDDVADDDTAGGFEDA